MAAEDLVAVSFEDVDKAFGGREVFSGLTVRIPARGFTFVVGRSGEGKSILCRMAVGLVRPDRGRIHLFGEAVHGLTERQALALRHKAPYLVQGPALLDWLTLLENVALAAPGKDPEVARAALERVGLGHAARARPTEVGPGLRKRAAIARALALAPSFLLLDEPTTGLDRASRDQVAGALEALRNEGLGAMVVSHDYPLLERLADRVVLVEGGRASLFEPAERFLRSDAAEVRALLAPVESEIGQDG